MTRTGGYGSILQMPLAIDSETARSRSAGPASEEEARLEAALRSVARYDPGAARRWEEVSLEGP